MCLREGCGYTELVKEGLPPEEVKRTASAAEAARRESSRNARQLRRGSRGRGRRKAEKDGEKAAAPAQKPAAAKKLCGKKQVPWMTKTTNRFKS